jgi:hypothetical protein
MTPPRKPCLHRYGSQRASRDPQTFPGLDLIESGRSADALPGLKWVRDHGNKRFVEHGIAVVEIDRIGKSGGEVIATRYPRLKLSNLVFQSFQALTPGEEGRTNKEDRGQAIADEIPVLPSPHAHPRRDLVPAKSEEDRPQEQGQEADESELPHGAPRDS